MPKKRSVVEDLKNSLGTMDKIKKFIENMDYEDFLEDEKTMFLRYQEHRYDRIIKRGFRADVEVT